MATMLTPSDVHKVALLSRLKLTDAEVGRFTQQLGDVLKYVEQLNEVNVDDVEPMVHAVEVQNVLRKDEVAPSLPREQALSNAPKTDGKYFLVPPILGAE